MMPRNNFDFLEFWWVSCRPAVSVSSCSSMTGILSPHLLLHRDLLSSVKCFITQLHGRGQVTPALHHCKYTQQCYCLYQSLVVACYFSIHRSLHESKTGFCFTGNSAGLRWCMVVFCFAWLLKHWSSSAERTCLDPEWVNVLWACCLCNRLYL